MEMCCGRPMVYREVFGVRLYACQHRSHHPMIIENLYTGQKVNDEDLERVVPDVVESDYGYAVS